MMIRKAIGTTVLAMLVQSAAQPALALGLQDLAAERREGGVVHVSGTFHETNSCERFIEAYAGPPPHVTVETGTLAVTVVAINSGGPICGMSYFVRSWSVTLEEAAGTAPDEVVIFLLDGSEDEPVLSFSRKTVPIR